MKNSLRNPSYLVFRISTGHYRGFGIHSPFLFSFIEKVLWPKSPPSASPRKTTRFEHKYGSVWQRQITQYPGKVELPEEFPKDWSFLADFSHPATQPNLKKPGSNHDHRLYFAPENLNLSLHFLQDQKTSFLFLPGIHNLAHQALAWNHLKDDPAAGICIDLYHLGIVICRKGLQKESFTINF